MLKPDPHQWIPKSLRFLGSVSFIICLIVSTILWFLVKLSKTAVKDLEFQLKYEIPADKTFGKLAPQTLSTKITGQGFELFLGSKKDQLIVPLLNRTTQYLNQNDLSDLIRNKLKSTDLNLLSIETGGIQIELEEKLTKKVLLELRTKIKPAPGFIISGGVNIKPDSVTLTGPKTMLINLSSWPLLNPDFHHVQQDIKTQLPIQEDATGLVKISDSNALLNVKIDVITEKSIFIPIRTAGDSIKSIPGRAELIFEIGLSEFEKFDADKFKIGTDDAPNNNLNRVKLILLEKPESIEKFKILPDSVRLIYETEKGQ